MSTGFASSVPIRSLQAGVAPTGTRISVVTVCFNAEATIERTIRSMASQRYPNVEYIVVDGASTDRTLGIVRDHAGSIDIFTSERDAGIFDAMNKGIGMATGDVIYFLNADDHFVDDQVLGDVAQAFDADPGCDLVYAHVVLDGAPGELKPGRARPFTSHSISEFLHNSFCHQAVFARRALFDRIGRFDCSYRYSADYEWIIRAFKQHRGRNFHFLDRDIARYFYLGRSRQNAGVTQREVNRMQFAHLLSMQYLWYFFRYVLVRGVKKKLLNETY